MSICRVEFVSIKSIIHLVKIVILFFFSTTFPLSQEQNHLDSAFYSTCVPEEYVSGFNNGKTPRDLFNAGSYFKQMYLERESGIVNVSSLHEGFGLRYQILSSTEIKVLDSSQLSNGFVLTLVNEKGEAKLLMKEKDKTTKFVLLPSKYNNIGGLNQFVNDRFLTGLYKKANGGEDTICFSTAGEIKGIEKYNRYRITISPLDEPREFDTIVLTEFHNKVLSSLTLCWKRENNKLILYKLSANNPTGKISEKYLELIKID